MLSKSLCSGYSKNEDLTNSLSKSGCGTPEYVAPEVRLACKHVMSLVPVHEPRVALSCATVNNCSY